MLWNDNQKIKKKECKAPVEYFMQEGNKILREELGIKNTNYASPHGLSNTMNKTTCYDMAIVTINTMKNNVCKKIAC